MIQQSSSGINVSRRGIEHRLTAHVSYQLPPYQELRNRFESVSSMFDGSHEQRWGESAFIRGKVDRTPCEKNFVVKYFDYPLAKIHPDHVITGHEVDGYRVAIREEAIDLVKGQPRLFLQHREIIALGSNVLIKANQKSSLLDDEIGVTRLSRRGRRWDLLCSVSDYGLPTSWGFLLIQS